MLGSDPEVSDLLQDVFVAAFQGIGRLQDPLALPAWLNQIAVNLARGHIRERVQDRALFGEPSGDVLAPDLPLDDQYAMHEALARLPQPERTIFTLRFFAQLELSEVASVCEVSIPTIKRRLISARRRLAQQHDAITRLTNCASARPKAR